MPAGEAVAGSRVTSSSYDGDEVSANVRTWPYLLRFLTAEFSQMAHEAARAAASDIRRYSVAVSQMRVASDDLVGVLTTLNNENGILRNELRELQVSCQLARCTPR